LVEIKVEVILNPIQKLGNLRREFVIPRSQPAGENGLDRVWEHSSWVELELVAKSRTFGQAP